MHLDPACGHFFRIFPCSSGDVESTKEGGGAGWTSGGCVSNDKGEWEVGERVALDDENDKRHRDFTRRRCLIDEREQEDRSGMMGMLG
jgi:hypothetical protein